MRTSHPSLIATAAKPDPPFVEPAGAFDLLPATPFERFLRLNDTPASPMVFRILMRFSGDWDRRLLSQAYRLAIARQPLLTSQLERHGRELVWKQCDEIRELEWRSAGIDECAITGLDVEPIDLLRESGCRMRAWPVSEGLVVVFEVHHACCDGQGGRQVLWDWLSAYTQLVRGERPQLAHLELHRLPDRAAFIKASDPVTAWEGLRNFLVTVRGRNVRLGVGQPEPRSKSRAAWIAERPLTVDETARVRQRLRDCRLSMNDLGLAATIETFHTLYSRQCMRRFITVANTVDLRRPSDLALPACNRMGFAFVRRRRRDWSSFDELLASVRSQMQYVKRKYVGAEVVHGLASAATIPGGLAAVVHSGLFTPTLQFTCMGDVTRAVRYRSDRVDGDVDFSGLRVRRVAGFPPPGRNVPLSIAACETTNRLSLTARASTRHFTEVETRVFLDALANRFLSFAANETESRYEA